MKMKFVKMFGFAVLLSLVVALAGCGGNGGGGGNAGGGNAGGDAPVVDATDGGEAPAGELSGRIVVGGWPAGDEALQAAEHLFAEQFPNVEVEYQFMATEDFRQALITSLAAGSGAPDVVMIEGAWIGELRESPALENLFDAPFDAARLEYRFAAHRWDLAQSLDGRLTALPWDIGPATLFYRRDIFEEVGLPYEPEDVEALFATWDGFLEAAEAVHIPGERWLIPEAPSMFYWLFMNRDFFNEALEFQIDRPGVIETLDAAIIMRDNGWDAQLDMWSTEANAGKAGGNIVATVAGAWYGGFLKSWVSPENEGNWGVVRLPAGIPDSNWGGSFLAIPTQSNNQEAAWAYIETLMATPEAQNIMFETMDYFPALVTAWDDPMYDYEDPWFAGQRTRALWVDIADNTHPTLTTLIDGPMEGHIMDAVNIGLNTGMTSQEILDHLYDHVATVMREERAAAIDILRDAGRWQD